MIDGAGTPDGADGAGIGAGAGAGEDGALAQEAGTSRHTSSNPTSIVNLFIRKPPAYYPYYTITLFE